MFTEEKSKPFTDLRCRSGRMPKPADYASWGFRRGYVGFWTETAETRLSDSAASRPLKTKAGEAPRFLHHQTLQIMAAGKRWWSVADICASMGVTRRRAIDRVLQMLMAAGCIIRRRKLKGKPGVVQAYSLTDSGAAIAAMPIAALQAKLQDMV